MRRRLRGLQRLLDVYETIEEIREAEARRTASEVREVQQAIGRQAKVVREAASEGREALIEGDAHGRTFAATRQELEHAKRTKLDYVLGEREVRSAAARLTHQDSRQWSERMKQVVKNVESQIVEREEKQAQSTADDHYLSTRAWKRRQGLIEIPRR